jgi:hypothetical protein
MGVSHGSLKGGIHTLRIGGEIFNQDKLRKSSTTTRYFAHRGDFARRQADQDFIQSNGWVTARLALAFRALPHLKKVEIDLPNPVDLMGYSAQYCEGAYQGIESLQWGLSDIFASMLAAADASNTLLEEVLIQPFDGGAGLALSSFAFSQYQVDRRPSLFENLRKIQLALVMEQSTSGLLQVADFLSAAVRLEDLRLALHHNAGEGFALVEPHLYGHAGFADGLISGIALPYLRVCFFQDLEFSDKAIEQFIVANASLKDITMTRVNLCGFWKEIQNPNLLGWDPAREYPNFHLNNVFENYSDIRVG